MEFRPMRRSRQQLPFEECEDILRRNTAGVLAVLGDEGYPYTVPLSYVYEDRTIWFHCAKSGHKLDAIKSCDKVSFCVVDRDQVVPEEYTTYFHSVIAFGRAEIAEGDESLAAIQALADKYHPTAGRAIRDAAIAESLSILCMVRINVEHLTGKEAIELTKMRGNSTSSSMVLENKAESHGLRAMKEASQISEKYGNAGMTLEKINAEIDAARKEVTMEEWGSEDYQQGKG